MAVRKRWKLALVLACVAAAIASVPLIRSDGQPSYQGRSLSRWLAIYYESDRANADRAQRPFAAAAIRSIGTNAVPHFIEWIRYEAPAWHRTVARVLPRRIGNSRPARATLYRGYHRAEAARQGMRLLGTNAVSAIPALTAMMQDGSRPETAIRAIELLGQLGPAAFPALLGALADTNQPFRVPIAYCIAVDAAPLVGTNLCLSAIEAAAADSDPRLHAWALDLMRRLKGEQSLTAIPQSKQALDSHARPQ